MKITFENKITFTYAKDYVENIKDMYSHVVEVDDIATIDDESMSININEAFIADVRFYVKELIPAYSSIMMNILALNVRGRRAINSLINNWSCEE